MPTKIEKDDLTGRETTGHEWDGIKELNNPLPRWWLLILWVTIIWSIGYWILYPAWPIPGGNTKGILGYSSRAELVVELDKAKAAQKQWVEKINATPVDQISKDPQLFQFAVAGGRSAFGVNCAPCHGTGAQGGAGYPNLNDDNWIWGGTITDIYTTIQHGVRWAADPDTRQNVMPSFGADNLLTPAQIDDVAEFVLSLSKRSSNAAAVDRGKQVFADNCAVCHGPEGKGNTELGAPNLAANIWLYGGSKADIVRQVRSPRLGVMPAWAGRLDPATVKELAVYVYSLGGGTK